MRHGRLEDVVHTFTGFLPHLSGELRPVGHHKVLKTVSSRSRQLFVICEDISKLKTNQLKFYFHKSENWQQDIYLILGGAYMIQE